MSQSTQTSRSPSRKERILIIGLIGVGLILVLFFGFRAFRSYMRIQQTGLQPGMTNVEAIRGWMTIPYIATAYGVPEAYIFEAIGIPQEGNQNRSLRWLNGEYGDDQAAIPNAVKAAIRQYQAGHPPTPEPARD